MNDIPLRLDIERSPAAAVVRISGSASTMHAEAMRSQLEQLAEQKHPVIVLELSQMDFICSLGLAALICGHLKSRHHKGQIRLVNPQPHVMELLKATRLIALFPVFQSVDQALKA